MRILLTGASGFIGGAVARLLSAGHEVFATVRPDSASPPNCTPVICDLSAEGEWDLPQVDAIVHAAQSRHYKEFPERAAEVFAVNVGSTQKLLDHAARCKVKSFCLLSSVSVYEPDYLQLDERASLAPTSLNGATKFAAELIAAPFKSIFPISILRLAFPYGPGQVQRMISGLIERVRAGEPVELAGADGLHFAPLYVDDIAACVQKAIEEGWSDVFNVAGPQALSLRDFTLLIGRELGRQPVFKQSLQPALDFNVPLDRLAAKIDVSRFTVPEAGLGRTVRAPSLQRRSIA